ncbi:Leucine Rich Repeat family protein [Trichomonas vaginalis G3]|uniref:Leucine Rich Repeat family protein n=1 Tax=Trichomonas vaginalis (strain ATCC PRA-98 / G3) TaxID=412133 RepID=A2DEL9_TRIV3|nr:uncharacterized protein TVAGG3_0577650 [Trichomonas vaginalis G3]EAY21146.1 Leucine Rich Repeat family protein [Trichomonas vaginalis G3]KAI5522329.1 ribonuclease inhibitor domain-containing protein [Trichomonas vaginalis G3]|eukprot:XP_001582132.1 hypothetical protein [Trichomonas vaginalis G3]
MKETKKTRNPFLETSSKLKVTPFSTQELVVDQANIHEIGPNDLSFYPNLVALYIPHNKIEVLNNLEKNIRLTLLDARDNLIKDLNLSRQTFLTELYLSSNKLQDLEQTLAKIVHLRNLEVLDLRGNPLTLEKGYRQTVAAAMPWLKVLDGLDISAADRPKHTIKRDNSNSRPRRPQSILQHLMERPPSAADAVIIRKANKIRAQTALKQQRDVVEEKPVVVQQRTMPLPDCLTIGLRKQPKEEEEQKDKTTEIPRRKTYSRMYIKRPVYTKTSELSDNDQKLIKLNPDLPPIFTQLKSEKVMAN